MTLIRKDAFARIAWNAAYNNFNVYFGCTMDNFCDGIWPLKLDDKIRDCLVPVPIVVAEGNQVSTLHTIYRRGFALSCTEAGVSGWQTEGKAFSYFSDNAKRVAYLDETATAVFWGLRSPYSAADYACTFSIINNAVLNVMPQDLRDALVVKMGEMLKPGGRAFINVRGTDVKNASSKVAINDDLMEYFISNTGSYQKGFTQRELVAYLKDALGDGFSVEPTKKFGGVSATKTYNMFVNAVYDLRNAEGKDALKKAKRGLARTTTALVVSFAVNAVMQSIVDALRDDDKERDYWEKMLTAYTGFTGDEETLLDYWNSFWSGNLEANFNPMGYLPYFKDMLSIAQGYDVSRMDMEPISKVWDAAVNMKKALSGEGKYSLAGASANLLAEASRLLGIPVANLKRDIQAGITTAAIETDSYLMQYRIDKAMLNMGYSGNTSNFMDILYNASINDREAYEIIYADMVASGIPEDKISNAMETRMKRDQGVESVADLEARYLTPKQEQSYNSLRQRVTGTTVWSAASAEQREALEEDLYDLTVANSSGLKLQEKIDGGAAYGIDEADYLLYRLALHVVDQPSESGKLGSYTGDEVEAAIDMLTGLDDEARAYLWEAAGKSEKSNPYK